MGEKSKSPYYQRQHDLLGVASILSSRIRKEMFHAILETVALNEHSRIIDVGVTGDQRPESNFFEKLYEYPDKITAVGIEDASYLESAFPGLSFVRAEGLHLPFEDKSFDLGISFAVIEHVGSIERQKRFVAELCRVSKSCCIATPNRWYPIEFHTLTPLLHWLPAHYFRKCIQLMGNDFYSRQENLNLLSEKDLLALFPENVHPTIRRFRLFGFVSNIVALVDHAEASPHLLAKA